VEAIWIHSGEDMSMVVDFKGNVVRLDGSKEDDTHEMQWRLASQVLAAIRTYLFQHSGYTCSGGIATTKAYANIACGLRKPNMQSIFISPDAGMQRIRVPPAVRALPLGNLLGVGWKTSKQLRDTFGTIGDLGDATPSRCSRLICPDGPGAAGNEWDQTLIRMCNLVRRARGTDDDGFRGLVR
jgi:nucleotidyltransferase/DNA polymerase involved in DNA repair